MKRFIDRELIRWKDDFTHKPLILTGARQVGKTYVVERNLAPHFNTLLSINFERQPEYKSCFEAGFDPLIVIRRLEALSGQRIEVGKTLLFFDEAQACPEAITSLRYFYEEMPGLHVIAAGSLLEFIIDAVSVPIGRVTYRHLSPLSFEEFLVNSGNDILLDEIKGHDIRTAFPGALHQKAVTLLKEYMAIGGMPQVVASYIEKRDYLTCQELLSDLLEAYEQDFPKYGVRDTELKYVDMVFTRAPHLVGNQFKFVQVTRDIQAKYLRKGLELLVKAGVVTLVYRTSGVPLGAHYNPHRVKLLFLDIGLMQRACGLSIDRWITNGHELVNAGPLAEQFVGQEIVAHSGFRRQRLYYWRKDKRGSSAEVDYLIQDGAIVIPVEVKSGAVGKLRSLHRLLESYPDMPEGIKVSLDNFGKRKKIQSIPLYAFGSWLSRKELNT